MKICKIQSRRASRTNKIIAILTKISSFAAQEFVILTTSGAASDENLIEMKTSPFQDASDSICKPKAKQCIFFHSKVSKHLILSIKETYIDVIVSLSFWTNPPFFIRASYHGNHVRLAWATVPYPVSSLLTTPGHHWSIRDSKLLGANMGPVWGRQDPVGPHVGPMNFALWDDVRNSNIADMPFNAYLYL